MRASPRKPRKTPLSPQKKKTTHNTPTGGSRKLFEVLKTGGAKIGGMNRDGWAALALNDAKLFLFIRAFKEISAH